MRLHTLLSASKLHCGADITIIIINLRNRSYFYRIPIFASTGCHA